MQEFTTLYMLRLWIADDPIAGSVINLCRNPDGAQGGWWWITPKVDTTMAGVTGPQRLRFTTLTSQSGVVFTSQRFACAPGHKLSATYTERISTAYHRNGFAFYDAFGNQLSVTAASSYYKNTSGSAVRTMAPATAPANTHYAEVRFAMYGNTSGGNPSAGDHFDFNDVEVYVKPIGTETEVSQAYNTLELDAVSVQIVRDALNLGTMTVRLRAADYGALYNKLDPGHEIYAEACVDVTHGTYERIFTGVTSDLSGVLDAEGPTDRRLDITLTAVDNTAILARTPSTSSVALTTDLPHLLERAIPAVPWKVDGSTASVGGITVQATDTGAKLLDQIIRTRDTAHGFGWVDRNGVVNVVSEFYANTFMTSPDDTLDEDDYQDTARARYNTKDVINTIEVVNWVGTASTTYGPYVSQSSVDHYGPRTVTFTVIDVPDAGLYFLDVIGTGIDQAVVCMSEAPLLAFSTAADIARWCVRDLYDVLDVRRPDGFSNDMWITGITHTITHDRWYLTFRLALVGRAALPTT